MTPEVESPIRVLLLDDEPFIRGTIKRLLRAFDNIEVREAGDGAEGLALMDAGFCPDVVLCDVLMAPLDGLAFLQAVRRSGDLARAATPIIMLTAAADEETVRSSGALGAFAYLVKPISLTLLTDRLNAALRKADGGKLLRRHTPPIGAANTAAGLGQSALQRLIYFSRFGSAMPPEGSAQSDEIDRIMAVAMRNNTAQDVTGMLLVHHGLFIQALEGATASVAAIYNRILLDPRHQGVTIITMGLAAERKFRGWHICASHLDQADTAILATLDRKGALDPASLTPATSLSLLTTIATIHMQRPRGPVPVAK